MSDLVGNPEDRFSHNEAYIKVCHVEEFTRSYSPCKSVTTRVKSLLDPTHHVSQLVPESCHTTLTIYSRHSLKTLQIGNLLCVV